MARIDRVARWVASGILAERGVEKTPASMAAVMPVCYVFAEAVVKALADLSAEWARELADAPAVTRRPVPAGAWPVEVDLADLAAWECEFSGDDTGGDGGV